MDCVGLCGEGVRNLQCLIICQLQPEFSPAYIPVQRYESRKDQEADYDIAGIGSNEKGGCNKG